MADKKMAPVGRAKGRFMASIVAAPGVNAARVASLGLVRAVLSCALLLPLFATLGGCAWLSAKQSQLALRPTAGRPAGLADDSALFRPGDVRWQVSVASVASASPNGTARPAQLDQLALWWLPHADPQAPTLLYLHGTFRNLYQNLSKIDALREAGYSVVAVDYRGWGDSTAIVPTEESITADAREAWAEVLRRQPDASRRVIFGHSMGGAVAVRLASTLKAVRGGGSDYAALVLESTFTRLPDIAAAAGFWGRIAAAATTLEFNSLSRIGRVDAPVLMLHGSADRTVPVALGRRLRDAAPPGVMWVEIEGGTHSRLHSDAPERYQQALTQLLQSTKSRPAVPSRATSP